MKKKNNVIPLIQKKQAGSFSILIHENKIAIQFAEPVKSLIFTQAQALELAQMLVKLNHEIERNNAAS